MSQLTAKETAEFRQLFIDKHSLDIQERITKIAFVDEKGRPIVWFHVYDSYRPPEPPKTEYKLVVINYHERTFSFKSKKTLDTAFNVFANGDETVLAYEDGRIIKQYIPN